MKIWSWFYCSLALISIIIIPHYQTEVNAKGTPSATCNPNLYERPECLDQTTHYHCRCNPGFVWNGQMCVSTAVNSYFEFNKKSKNHFVLLEKTFPELTSFTISTWLQIHNYFTLQSELLNTETLNNEFAKKARSNNDIRSIFSYSLNNFKNAISCQIKTSLKSKSKNIKRTKVRLNLTVKIYDNICKLDVKHLYLNELYWFHVTFAWESATGKVNFYINGKLKAECSDIATNQVISAGGEFVLGQSHQEPVPVSVQQLALGELSPTTKPTKYQDNFDETDGKSSNYDRRYSFVGRLFNFNIWDRAFGDNLVKRLFRDGNLIYCGNATQWSDFRQGTIGDVKMKWPTKLLWKSPQLSKNYQLRSCNQFCHRWIGPICRESFERNIRWPTTKGNSTTQIQCFPVKYSKLENLNLPVKYAYRHCDMQTKPRIRVLTTPKSPVSSTLKKKKTGQYGYVQYNFTVASWSTANIDECVQQPLLELNKKVLLFYTIDNFDDTKIFVYLDELYDMTIKIMYKNLRVNKSMYDVSTIIDTLLYLINAQQQTIKRNLEMGFTYDFDDGTSFARRCLSIIDILIGKSKDVTLWGGSIPIGADAVRISKLVQDIAEFLHQLQKLHFNDKSNENLYIYSPKYKRSIMKANLASRFNRNKSDRPYYEIIELAFKNINFRQQLLYSEQQMPLNFKFPSNVAEPPKDSIESDKKTSAGSDGATAASTSKKKPQYPSKYEYDYNEDGPPKLQQAATFHSQIVFDDVNLILPINVNTNYKIFEPYSLLTVYYDGFESLFPNHNKTFRAKDNNINSMVITVELVSHDGIVKLDKSNYNSTFDKPIALVYDYLNNFNISDTRCVHLKNNFNDKTKIFEWNRDSCVLTTHNPTSAICECYASGSFSITNDLYDPSWMPIIIENIPLNLPAYFGCIIVSFLAVATFACLTYLKTKSVTTSIHKNLCIGVCVSQLLIIVSLSQIEFGENMCQIFGLMNHYMFFVVFAWLMNEAFNLYISITYAAHQSTPVNDNGSQWRTFYLLGWLFPALLITVLYITNSTNYYDKKLCWFNLDNLWINVSPMIAMLAITILVMIISAKEHTEISYTKNEKANKLISNHTKAVWTQITLLTLCWTFAIMSLVIYGSIIKYLYAFLNCLQGSFLFIFYFLLNEEVRKFWREKKRRNRLKTSTDKGLNLVNLVIGKDEDYDETLDETFETSDKEEYNKIGESNHRKSSKKKNLKRKFKSDNKTTPADAGPKTSTTNNNNSNYNEQKNSNQAERFFIEPHEWERNTTRRHSIVDIPGNTQEKITVL